MEALCAALIRSSWGGGGGGGEGFGSHTIIFENTIIITKVAKTTKAFKVVKKVDRVDGKARRKVGGKAHRVAGLLVLEWPASSSWMRPLVCSCPSMPLPPSRQKGGELRSREPPLAWRTTKCSGVQLPRMVVSCGHHRDVVDDAQDDYPLGNRY